MGIKGIILAIVCVASIHQAQARLDETSSSLIRRYGEPTKVEDQGDNRTKMEFSQDGWRIEAILYYDYCRCITYRKNTNEAAAAKNKLLQANASGTQWRYIERKELPFAQIPSGETMIRSDGKAYAQLDSGYMARFCFFTAEWVNLNKPKETPVGSLPNF